MDRENRHSRPRGSPVSPAPAAASPPAASASAPIAPSAPARRTPSVATRAASQRLAQGPAASQQSNSEDDAEEDLNSGLDGKNWNGSAAPAPPQSPGVSPSSGTPQQQQQKQLAQQQSLPGQQNPQQLQQQAQTHHSQQQSNTQAASGGTAAPPGGEGRRISCDDIQLVQNLIERCLQLYMNRVEVINTLLNQAKIEPGFTGLVWQKLEEQNPDFFKAYYVRLKLKKQIMVFNDLLEQQAQLTQKLHPAKPPLQSSQNGMHASQVHHMPIGYPVPQQPSMAATSHPHIVPMPVASLSPPVMSGAPIAEAFGAAHSSPGSNGVGDVISLLPNVSNMPLNNDLSMGPAAVLHGNSSFPFTAMGNPTDISGMGMDVPSSFPPDAPFHSSENHTQNGMGTLQITTDADVSGGRELGLLGTLPRNFSLSDLTAELTNSSDILGSYTGSPFLSPDADVFIRSSDDEKMLDQITDPSGYDDFEDEK